MFTTVDQMLMETLKINSELPEDIAIISRSPVKGKDLDRYTDGISKIILAT